MKRLITAAFILVFSLIASVALGDIAITSLPYNIPTSGETYYLDVNSMTTTGSGINGNGKRKWTLRWKTPGTYDSLGFNSSGGSNNYGIRIDGDSITLIGVRVYEISNLQTAVGNVCVLYNNVTVNSNNLTIYQTELNAGGARGNCILSGSNANRKNLFLSNSTFSSRSCWYPRRDLGFSDLVRLEVGDTLLPGEFSLRVQNCAFISIPHDGISFANIGLLIDANKLGVIQVDTAVFSMANRNLEITDSTGSAVENAADDFAISLWGSGPGSYIRNINVQAEGIIPFCGGENYGGLGILLQGSHGTASSPIIIENFNMAIKQGIHPSALAQRQDAQGIYLRRLEVYDSPWQWHQYVTIRNGIIRIFVDSSHAAPLNTGYRAQGIRIGHDSLTAHVTIENVRSIIQRTDGVTNDAGIYVAAIAVSHGDTLSPTTEWGNQCKDNFAKNCYFEAPHHPVMFGAPRIERPACNYTLWACTLNTTFNVADVGPFFRHEATYYWHSTNNHLLDCVYQGFFDPADYNWGTSFGSMDSLGKSYDEQRTVQLFVSLDGDPLPGVTVTGTNAYSHAVWSAVSDVNGIASGPVRYKFYGKDPFTSDSWVVQDSVVFNPFTFSATYSGQNGTAVLTVSPTSYADTIAFSSRKRVAFIVGTDTTALYKGDTLALYHLRYDLGWSVPKIKQEFMRDSSTNYWTNNYDGYVITAKVASGYIQYVPNLRGLALGGICLNRLAYDALKLATSNTTYSASGRQVFGRMNSSSWVSNQMPDSSVFRWSGAGQGWYWNGIASGVTKLYCNGSNTSQVAFGVVDVGGTLTSGTAAGRRMFFSSMGPMFFDATINNPGDCHPWEMLINGAAWTLSDLDNPGITNLSCYVETEVGWCWTEMGDTLIAPRDGEYTYEAQRAGIDHNNPPTNYGRVLGFTIIKDLERKLLSGYKADSLVVIRPVVGLGREPDGNDDFDFTEYLHEITTDYSWHCPGNASPSQAGYWAGNYEESTWVNRFNVIGGNVGNVNWGAFDMLAGTDYTTPAFDSVHYTPSLTPAGSSVRYKVPASILSGWIANPSTNKGTVGQPTAWLTGALNDIEVSFATPTGLNGTKLLLYSSPSGEPEPPLARKRKVLLDD